MKNQTSTGKKEDFFTNENSDEVEKCGKGKHLTDTIECDDGNLLNGDGCDKFCKIETNWKCKDNEEKLSVCYDARPFVF